MTGENYGEVFEYDEDNEASDELFVESDGSGEVDETDEGSDEFVEASDEVAEASDEGSDEFVEASDEGEASDEMEAEAGSDEAVDEAVVSASARLQATQDRNRRAQWARRIAADQRREAQRSATTERGLRAQIRSIPTGGPTRVATVGPLQGAGVVTAILPNGRRSRMRIVPTVAPISEVNRLRSVITVNDRRQAIATSTNTRAITALATTQAVAVRKLSAEQVKSDRDLRKRLVEGDNRLDKRITKELTGGSGSLDKHGKRTMRHLKRQRQRSILNSVLLASSMPFFAAYGDRSKPWAKNNLILTGSLLGWMLGDEIIDSVGGKSRGARGAATAWSYLAPVGNGATAYFALRKKQHERFVSGITTTTAAQLEVKVDLKKLIATGSFDDFATKDHAIATNVVASQAGTVVKVEFSQDKAFLVVSGARPDLALVAKAATAVAAAAAAFASTTASAADKQKAADDATAAINAAAASAVPVPVTVAWMIDTYAPTPARTT